MVFWRNRSAKKADTPIIVEAEGAATSESAKPDAGDAQTNVVTLVTSRLADRLADVAGLIERAEGRDAKSSKEVATNGHGEHRLFAGQKRAVTKIRAALATKPGEHLLILGEPGTGRLEIARALAAEVARTSAQDWAYVIERDAPSRARAFALPSGSGARFTREVRAAIEKACAAFDRHIKSDEHRISLDLLEEETRHRGETAVEQVRRRAEAQNIALVKSLDGYVLAPMHEGRVVRSDVFRALPEALKRNVEAKITALEDELQSIVATLPDVEFEANAKYGALIRQAAMRSIGPSLAPVKKLFADTSNAVTALEAIEDSFLAAASGSGEAQSFAPVAVLDIESGEEVTSSPHRVFTAKRATVAELFGEIGRNAAGRLTILPGQLVSAGSGIVLIEAWKLAADPQAWVALSAAMSEKKIAPLSAPGIAVRADPVPLSATIVVVADAQSWSKLEAIEPGVARHFPNVAKLAETAPIAELGEEEFAKSTSQLGAEHGLKPLAPAVAPLIYKDAVRRGGGRVSLSEIALLHLLKAADGVARAHFASEIRASDLNDALKQRADGDAP